MSRNILIFSLAYPPFIGGAELAVKEITDRLPNYHFTLITANIDGRQPVTEQLGRVSVYRIGRGRLAKYTYPWTAVRLANHMHATHQFDIAWAIMANQAGMAALRFIRQHPAVQYLLTLQEGDSTKKIWSRTWWMRRTYKNIYRRANFIQAISHFLGKRATRLGYAGPMAVVPNGVSIDHFGRRLPDARRRDLRAKLRLKPSDRVVVTSSRLVAKNGLDILIRAMQGTPAILVILGSGKQAAKLRSLALDLGVSDQIRFVGHIGHDVLPSYLQLADVFVRPSRSEGLGSSFIEAMAAGLPIIGTPVGGIPDVLHDGENGLFCQLGNPRDLADKITRILDDDALRQRLAAGGRKFVEQYDWNQIAKRMDAVFKQLPVS